MSTTEPAGVDRTVDGCRPADVEPVVIDGADLESTAPEHLRDLKAELAARGYQAATLSVPCCFAEDCSLATQEEADRLRRYVRAAAFLGAGRLTLEIDEVAEPAKVAPALEALSERARREGVSLTITGNTDLTLA